ncbi:MAG: DNA methyltransferase [Thermoplasmata archaeon]
MQIILERNLGYGTLPDSELAHVLRAEKIEARILWSERRKLCIEIEGKERLWVKRLALWHRGFEVLHNGSIQSILEFACGLRVNGSFCVRVEHEPELAREIGARLRGKVDLRNPEHLFYVFKHDNYYFLTRKFWSIDNKEYAKREPKSRPFFMPISLHPKLARAMVNLAEVRKGDVVLDPFCGTGGILIEAGLLGARVIGNDIRQDIVAGAAKNLQASGIQGFELFRGDVGEVTSKVKGVDAIITDPPYGRSTTTGKEPRERLYNRAFETFAALLSPGKKLVLILPFKIDNEIPCFALQEQHPIYVHKSLIRHLCVFMRV